MMALFGCSAKYTSNSPKYTKYKGEINHHTRLIKANRSELFDIITDEQSYKKICDGLLTITYHPPLPYQAGTIVSTQVEVRQQMHWQSHVEEIIPSQMIRLKFIDGFFAGCTEIWEIEQEGEMTRVSHTTTVNPKNIKETLFWVLKARNKHDDIIETVLDNLQASVEDDGSSVASGK